jgi:hypothetical protein
MRLVKDAFSGRKTEKGVEPIQQAAFELETIQTSGVSETPEVFEGLITIGRKMILGGEG